MVIVTSKTSDIAAVEAEAVEEARVIIDPRIVRKDGTAARRSVLNAGYSSLSIQLQKGMLPKQDSVLSELEYIEEIMWRRVAARRNVINDVDDFTSSRRALKKYLDKQAGVLADDSATVAKAKHLTWLFAARAKGQPMRDCANWKAVIAA